MNAKQNSKIRMFHTTRAFLADHEPVWRAHPAFAAGVAEFSQRLAGIDQLTQQQDSDGGVMAAKHRALRRLGDLAYEVAAGTYACAFAEGNETLAHRARHRRFAVTRGSDAVVIGRCEDILLAATEAGEALLPWGVTPARLALLQGAIDTYRDLRTQPREVQANRKTITTKTLPLLIRQASDLLVRRLDRLVAQFRESDAGFVNGYTAARIIVDPPTRHRIMEPGVPAAQPASTLSKAA